MKIFGKVMAVITALAAIAGAVYVIATYGDKIVAWARNLLKRGKGEFEFDEYDYDELDEMDDEDEAFEG